MQLKYFKGFLKTNLASLKLSSVVPTQTVLSHSALAIHSHENINYKRYLYDMFLLIFMNHFSGRE